MVKEIIIKTRMTLEELYKQANRQMTKRDHYYDIDREWTDACLWR